MSVRTSPGRRKGGSLPQHVVKQGASKRCSGAALKHEPLAAPAGAAASHLGAFVRKGTVVKSRAPPPAVMKLLTVAAVLAAATATQVRVGAARCGRAAAAQLVRSAQRRVLVLRGLLARATLPLWPAPPPPDAPRVAADSTPAARRAGCSARRAFAAPAALCRRMRPRMPRAPLLHPCSPRRAPVFSRARLRRHIPSAIARA